MKKVNTILVVVLILGSLSTQAQFKFGLKGGANLAKINSTDPQVILDNKTGWHGGVMAEIELPFMGLEVDALYSQSGSKVDFTGVVQDLKNTYLAVPILAKVSFLKVLNIHAGPQFSVLTSSKLDLADYKDKIANKDFQVVFGAGLEFMTLHASLRYTLGVQDINIDTAKSYDLKNNAVMLSVGVWLK